MRHDQTQFAPVRGNSQSGVTPWSLGNESALGSVLMPKPYTPLAVANTFISLFGADRGIEHMKLQKLVYCAHGWWLASYDDATPHLLDERPQVWKHGPVFDSMYRILKVFGSSPIREPQSLNPFFDTPSVDEGDDNVRHLVHWIWSRYGHLSSFALSDLTHRPGTPWSRVASEHNYRVPFNMAIPDDYIREEFRTIMQRERVPSTAVTEGKDEFGRATA